MPKQETSVSTTGTPAIEFSAPDQRWKIEEGVLVRTEGDDAVFTAFDHSTLVNKGTIISDEYTGVSAKAVKDFTLINKATGIIFGGQQAVRIDNPFVKKVTIENAGSIFSTGEYSIYSNTATKFSLTNFGEIIGSDGTALGIGDGGPGPEDGPVIDNHGLISGLSGIELFINNGMTATITNHAGAKIKGGGFAIRSDQGAVSLTNEGKIKGTVIFEAADEPNTVVNEGKIDGNVELGTGEDTVVNAGEIDGNVFLGDGEDTYENDGGKAGKVFGGEGKDKLIAGKSKDEFVFQAPDSVDRVKNFESGKDKFFLDNAFFGDLPLGPLAGSAFEKGTEADDANDRIIYDKDTGKLYFDADGDGDGNQIKFAKLDAGTKLKADDFEVLLLV